MKALYLVLGVISAVISIGVLSDKETTGIGVFFAIVAVVFIAVGLKKQKKPAASSPAPSLPLNGARIAPISNPYPVTPAPVRYAPSYAPTMNGMILYKHYRNVGIYTPENMLPNLSVVSRFDKVRFVPEPQNTYDPGAVRVMSGRVAIGYLYKNNFQEMIRRFLERSDCDVLGHIAGIENGKVTIDEAFYRISEPLFECALTSNSSNAAQEGIDLCEINDILQIEYDYEKDAFCAEDCGKIPKKYAEELDEDGVYIGIVLDKYFSGEGITDTKQNLKIAVYETAD
ncbi:MAG: HIRAN domain-containing protein [Ruminococcus sp.]|nr:HIRAN domain-containing protein [Ruminococcus sp.]